MGQDRRRYIVYVPEMILALAVYYVEQGRVVWLKCSGHIGGGEHSWLCSGYARPGIGLFGL